jgi:hypothetical protein
MVFIKEDIIAAFSSFYSTQFLDLSKMQMINFKNLKINADFILDLE